jgi:hypothetical protein
MLAAVTEVVKRVCEELDAKSRNAWWLDMSPGATSAGGSSYVDVQRVGGAGAADWLQRNMHTTRDLLALSPFGGCCLVVA